MLFIRYDYPSSPNKKDDKGGRGANSTASSMEREGYSKKWNSLGLEV